MGNTSAFSRAASSDAARPPSSLCDAGPRPKPAAVSTHRSREPAGHSRFPVQTLFPQPRPALWFRVTGKADPSRSGLKRDLALTDPPPGCSCSSVDGSRPRGACPALPSQHDCSWTWPRTGDITAHLRSPPHWAWQPCAKALAKGTRVKGCVRATSGPRLRPWGFSPLPACWVTRSLHVLKI